MSLYNSPNIAVVKSGWDGRGMWHEWGRKSWLEEGKEMCMKTEA